MGGENPAPLSDLGPAFWPRMILILLFLLIGMDLANSWKAHGKSGRDSQYIQGMGNFLKSRPFAGMLLVAVMVALLPVIGFLPDCLWFLAAYGFLLGERRWGRLMFRSLAATVVLYVVFQCGLGLALPQGMGLFLKLSLLFQI